MGRSQASVALAATVLAAVGATAVSASNAIRLPPGTPDPKAMVLTSADLGGAKVTAQRYFKDRDFPSVISYVRELENGTLGPTSLPYVESQAEIGRSAVTTRQFLAALRTYFASREARELMATFFADELESGALVSDVKVGRPRNLGVGPDSFDVLVTARLLGRRIDLHIAAFSVERVLGLLTVVGDLGRPTPVRVITRLATIMAARTLIELVPQNFSLPLVSGTPALGQTLTASPGRWTGNPAGYVYRWQRCGATGSACASIPGATGRAYVVADADVGSTLRVAVTARGTVTSEPTTSAATGVVAVFIDTFSANGLGTSWTPLTTGTGPAITQVNGQLEITVPAGTSLGPQGYATGSAFMRCRLPGDFDMQVDYRLLSGLIPSGGINVGFDATEFTGDTYSGTHGMFIHNSAGNHGISTNFPDPGVYRPPYNDFVSDTSRSGTLRLVRSTRGGVTTMTASRLSGPSWSFTSLPYTGPTSQAANLNVFTNLTPFSTQVRVAFDNFRVSTGVMTCP